MPANKVLVGYDLGSSSIKVSIIDADSGKLLAAAQSPDTELTIDSPREAWAEQNPNVWWDHAVTATHKALRDAAIAPSAVLALGISYQMHGLVVVDKNQAPLRPAIIWCDSRAVAIGDAAYEELGEAYCREHLLNSPGNFTASKLKWVKDNEPHIYEKIFKVMLPGDYLAMRMTDEINTTVSGLSEGILWDYKNNQVSQALLDLYEIDQSLLAQVVPTFGDQGKLTTAAAAALGLPAGTPVTYRAGDQPNNAFSLRTLDPGEIAATAGTSGVIYGVSDKPVADKWSRVNAFAHVNHSADRQRLGLLLCINGTGIMNSWTRRLISTGSEPIDYGRINDLAAKAPAGAEGVRVFPFGNGAERVLRNRYLGASIDGINLTRHDTSHVCRAVQEGIVFSLAYGFEILEQMSTAAKVIRAGKANMFLSPVFSETFVNTIGASLELYNTDGAQGAARGAGVGAGLYTSPSDAFGGLACVQRFDPQPQKQAAYQSIFEEWKHMLQTTLDGEFVNQ